MIDEARGLVVIIIMTSSVSFCFLEFPVHLTLVFVFGTVGILILIMLIVISQQNRYEHSRTPSLSCICGVQNICETMRHLLNHRCTSLSFSLVLLSLQINDISAAACSCTQNQRHRFRAIEGISGLWFFKQMLDLRSQVAWLSEGDQNCCVF